MKKEGLDGKVRGLGQTYPGFGKDVRELIGEAAEISDELKTSHVQMGKPELDGEGNPVVVVRIKPEGVGILKERLESRMGIKGDNLRLVWWILEGKYDMESAHRDRLGQQKRAKLAKGVEYLDEQIREVLAKSIDKTWEDVWRRWRESGESIEELQKRREVHKLINYGVCAKLWALRVEIEG